VIAEGIIPDRVCAQCVRGHTNLCLTYDELGFTRAGAAADQVLVPAQVVNVLGGQVSLSPLITHRFPLEAYEQAYQVLRESFGPRGKVILDVNPEAPEDPEAPERIP
jgi:threonine dehydrogenase-like Zn-dependent dehydrogenase